VIHLRLHFRNNLFINECNMKIEIALVCSRPEQRAIILQLSVYFLMFSGTCLPPTGTPNDRAICPEPCRRRRTRSNHGAIQKHL
jgi:hypothetical protein